MHESSLHRDDFVFLSYRKTLVETSCWGDSLDILEVLYKASLFHCRDVQASSILLDDKFEVRLGSLSDACVAMGESHLGVLSRILRRSQ